MKNDIKDLTQYQWGLGLEHEMHIFHTPTITNKKIRDFTIFNSHKALNRLYQNYKSGKIILTDDELAFLKTIPYETSGRLCNEKWVIKRVPVKMPEFVTWYPFCSLSQDRDIANFSNEMILFRREFFRILMKDKVTQKLVKKYGELCAYPTGMTQYLTVPKEISSTATYKYPLDASKNHKVRPEYNGSYHITFTLPYKEGINKSEFIKMHQNFCNQLQWIEPLLLTAYFTGDELAPGSPKKRVRGSFRVLIIGWGNFAGTDIRLLDKGIGRYAKTPTYWRENLDLYEVDKLEPCYPPSPAALAENAITTLSSDIRTFGSTDPSRPEHRESGVGMTVPNGIEFRIFDHFQDKYIPNLVKLISLIAENSRVTKTTDYVYKNKYWIEAIHEIMKHGYRAELNQGYIRLLREKLGLKIKTSSIIAYDVFVKIFHELWEKNISGKWSLIFNNLQTWNMSHEIIPRVNERGWQLGFMVKCNRKEKILKSFNLLSKYLNHIQETKISDFHDYVISSMGTNWEDDVLDLAYFYAHMGYVHLTTSKEGKIQSLKVVKNIPHFDNFNESIVNMFQENMSLDNVKNFEKYSKEE